MRISTTVFLIFSILGLNGQDLPAMQDWFLPIGDWGSSPELYVVEIGTGPDTVVLLHGGWGADHKGLISAVTGLEDEFHFVLYDQRGSLHSPCPDSLISFNNHIEDVELLRKALNLKQLNIVGHSMGAVLGSAYANKYPERVSMLTLITPAYLRNPLQMDEITIRNKQGASQQQYMNRQEIATEMKKYGLDQENLSPQQNTGKFRINFASRMLFDVEKWPKLTGGRSLYQGHVYGLTEETYPEEGWDYISGFKEQAYPINFIGASHDFLDFGNGLIRKWAEEIDRANLQVVDEAGHITWIDQPKAFERALRRALGN